MLRVYKNFAQSYLYNHINARVVVYNYDINDERVIELLVKGNGLETAYHDPNVKYDLFHFSNNKEKFPSLGNELMFSNVLLEGKVVKTFLNGTASPALAEKFKNDLERYGIRLF